MSSQLIQRINGLTHKDRFIKKLKTLGGFGKTPRYYKAGLKPSKS
jgi:hypothetical protein